MRVKYKQYGVTGTWDLPYFVYRSLVYKYDDRLGIEDQLVKLQESLGNLLDTLMTKKIINKEELTKIINYTKEFEVVDE